jgi:stage V sporulation protein AE
MAVKPIWLMLLLAFVVGGLICVIGQLLIDGLRLTPAHAMSILVVFGVVLDGFNLYEPLIDFAGAGATVPITSFGNALFHGAMQEYDRDGWTGLLTGIFEVTSAGISAGIVFSFLAALLAKPLGR